MMAPFVSLALAVCEQMEFVDADGRKIAMRFCKQYSPEKIARIVERAKQYVWWRNYPKAAFMKAVGEVNRQEKGEDGQS